MEFEEPDGMGGWPPNRRPRQRSRRTSSWPIKGPSHGDEDRVDQAVDALVTSECSCILDLVDGGAVHTLEKTGAVLNVTRERARQIEHKGMKRLALFTTERGI